MGALQTKSPLERRNTIARRSQRRTLHNLKPKVDSIYKEIKKFKGINEDTHYNAITQEIEVLKNELNRRSRDLQPQVRNLYENIYKRISEAETALKEKLEENKVKNEKKNQQKQNEQQNQDATTLNNASEVMSSVGPDETVAEIHQNLANSDITTSEDDKRKTVQLTVVQVASEADSNVSKKGVISPIEKRKSILKAGGVAVMPGAVMNELTHSNRLTRFFDESDDEPDPAQSNGDKIKSIVQHLGEIEAEIAEFVGRKNGVKYNGIKSNLDRRLAELGEIRNADEYEADQLGRAKDYITSCLRFLDEKAMDFERRRSIGDDDVFGNNNVDMEDKVAKNFKLQQLLRNTAV
ncbi:uncharacterized protein LOC115881115 [Sitophilus oryzae]|uniref:Uncharacterized protein LOC115881115 n=1 Tax=Sitophilus oryzae TaxID=7048 RepID=A0A6J2XSB2_SITOR|nr:uncharacterized protein LOC115881115 [Sitophilus oryzae]